MKVDLNRKPLPREITTFEELKSLPTQTRRERRIKAKLIRRWKKAEAKVKGQTNG